MTNSVRLFLLVPVLVGGALVLTRPPTAQAQSVSWYKHRDARYKLQICLNSGMRLKAGRRGKWGMLSAKQGNVRVVAMAYTGRARFRELQQTAIAVSGIPSRNWRRVEASAAKQGFGRKETYLATGPRDMVVGFLAKHGRYVDRNYIVFVKTRRSTFLAHQKTFEAWATACARSCSRRHGARLRKAAGRGYPLRRWVRIPSTVRHARRHWW